MDSEIKHFKQSIGAQQLVLQNAHANYFILDKLGIIIKISRIPKPFWGVGKKYIELFNSKFDDFVLVLLDSETSGWYFRKNSINNFINQQKWRLSETDHHYKIVLPLPDENRFQSINDFSSKLNLISRSSNFPLS